MLIDFRTLASGKEIKADICIIGAGAAGISLSRSLIDSGIDVCLLESGGFDFEDDIQALYDGESTGLSMTGVKGGCRLRYFGGSTNHWAGYCSPLDELDFKTRSWVPDSGWPFQKSELSQYYTEASKVCEIKPTGYNIESIEDALHQFPGFTKSKIDMSFWQLSPPTRFGKVYRNELKKAKNVKVYLYANVIELVANENASALQSVKIQTLDGKKGTVRAKYFVLACGGIENARMLLLSDKVEKEGLGNGSGLVGRYFMQHVEYFTLTKILANHPSLLISPFLEFKKWNSDIIPVIHISAAAQEQHRLLNCAFSMNKVWHHKTGYDHLVDLWHEIKQGRWSDHSFHELKSVVKDMDSVATGIYNRIQGKKYHYAFDIELHVRCEQRPNPDSRVTLTNDRDQFGLRKVNVDWRLTDDEKITIRESLHLMGQEFGRLGLGRIKIPEFLLADETIWPQPIWSGCHHMTTTKMSQSPEHGVVNKDCRVHSVNNLYVAGSSVFPTGGYTMPTLTIVALALRLGEHLKEKLSKRFA